jgi:hypothetical protein
MVSLSPPRAVAQLVAIEGYADAGRLPAPRSGRLVRGPPKLSAIKWCGHQVPCELTSRLLRPDGRNRQLHEQDIAHTGDHDNNLAAATEIVCAAASA